MLGALTLLSGCGTLIHDPVKIQDEDLYYLKQASDAEFAVMMHFLTSGERQISRQEWDSMSQGKVCMDLSAFGDLNTEIGKLCSQVPCDYKTALRAFFYHLSQVAGVEFAEKFE